MFNDSETFTKLSQPVEEEVRKAQFEVVEVAMIFNDPIASTFLIKIT